MRKFLGGVAMVGVALSLLMATELIASTMTEAKTPGPVCWSIVKWPSDPVEIRKLKAVWSRHPALSGYCSLPK